MLEVKSYKFWFVTGSQPLYGPETLLEVEDHSKKIVAGLNESDLLPNKIEFKQVATTAEEIHALALEANASEDCAGLITWMHTFSPAKSWIAGLKALQTPLLHFHTQFNRDIPWETIDMDFMNTNQAAHGDREYGFIGTRLEIGRKVIVGFWKDEAVIGQIGKWMKTAIAV